MNEKKKHRKNEPHSCVNVLNRRWWPKRRRGAYRVNKPLYTGLIVVGLCVVDDVVVAVAVVVVFAFPLFLSISHKRT